MPVLPVTIDTGTVTGYFATLETTPTGLTSLPLAGSLTFEAAPTYFIDVSAKKIYVPKPFAVDLVDGAFTVNILATDEADFMPIAWTWKVTYNLTGFAFKPMNIAVPGGTTVDLTMAVPLASSGGVLITKGEKGDPGGGTGGTGTGADGKSAYQLAVDGGYVGTQTQWLLSLKGANGTNSTVPGPAGSSAYQVAVAGGFVGTQAAWLASLQGATGATGGITGTIKAWDAGTATYVAAPSTFQINVGPNAPSPVPADYQGIWHKTA